MALGTRKGRGSTLRFMVMTDLTLDVNGNYKRPANFAANALVLPEVTSSDTPITVASTTDTTPVMYGSAAPGAGEDWTDADPGAASWTITFTGNVQPVEADRAAMEAGKLAMTQRKILWIERTPLGENVAEGGAMFITSGGFPIPADTPETFSFTGTGKKKFFLDTSTATAAV